MVEKEIDVEVLAPNIEPVLPPQEGKALAEFDQELLQVADELRLEIALLETVRQGEEVEDVGVLERLLRQFRLRGWQKGGEIGGASTVACMGRGLDLES